MAETKEAVPQGGKINLSKYHRQKLREVLKQLGPGTDALFKRQVEEEDLFDVYYDREALIRPSYAFDNLYQIYEQSDILQSCVEAYQMNVDGFGYQMQFLGDDIKGKDSPTAQAELKRAQNFFDRVNPEQSFMQIRKLMREDLEVTGSGGFECIRNRRGELMMMFHAPIKSFRMSKLDHRPTSVDIVLPRDGKPVTVKYSKRFRKWAQITNTGRKIRWFKEFGDPRPMKAYTGERTKGGVQATEFLHYKLPFGSLAYGLPRWIGAVLEAIGRRNAQYVNWDLFESQGIPPMAVMVSGGVLTDESVDELEMIIRSMRGVEQWNKIMLLESTIESVGLEEKGTAKIELKNLNEYRKEDQMFEGYLSGTEKSVRHRFRLPPLYVGAAENFTHATAKAAQSVAEEQVFIPERSDFDETLNTKVVFGELDISEWTYQTRGPRIVGASEISKGVETFGKAGAFTINHAIAMANEAFGLEMSKYDDDWANYPLPVVLELLKRGELKGVEEIREKPKEPPKPPVQPLQLPGGTAPPGQKLLPGVTEKMLGTDMFSDEEKDLYRMLTTIQAMVERTTGRGRDASEL